MKALLIDDERLARNELRRLLAAHADIEIAGEAVDVEDARAKVAALRPDLLFLDVQMPGADGFSLLEQLEAPLPLVIFTTAYDEFAVKAFEFNALDYVLKPIDPERLAMALSRVRAAPEPAPPDATTSYASATTLERLFVKDGSRCWFVPLREVRLIASEGNYVRLFWGGQQPLLGRALASLEKRLDAQRFFRANRQQIINLDLVEKVEMGTAGTLRVQLRGDPEVEISRRQARLFKARAKV